MNGLMPKFPPCPVCGGRIAMFSKGTEYARAGCTCSYFCWRLAPPTEES